MQQQTSQQQLAEAKRLLKLLVKLINDLEQQLQKEWN